jgi:hypothetical protein
MKKTIRIRSAVNFFSAIAVYTVIYCSGTEIGNPEAGNDIRDQTCYADKSSYLEDHAQRSETTCLLNMDIMEYMKLLP